VQDESLRADLSDMKEYFDDVENATDASLAKVEDRVDMLEGNDETEEQLEAMEKKFDSLEASLETLEGRLDALDRGEGMDGRALNLQHGPLAMVGNVDVNGQAWASQASEGGNDSLPVRCTLCSSCPLFTSPKSSCGREGLAGLLELHC